VAIMPSRILIAILVLVCAAPTFAKPKKRSRAVLCKQACGDTIQACVDAGGRPRKCRTSVIRRCRIKGLGVCLAASSPERTYMVAPTGADSGGCGAADAPCRTIQFVIDVLVAPGGAATIKVATGTYSQLASCAVGTGADSSVVCIVDREIHLLGGFVPPNWDTAVGDPAATVIDAQGQGR